MESTCDFYNKHECTHVFYRHLKALGDFCAAARAFFKKRYLSGCTRSRLWQAGPLVVACELLVAACMWDLVP